MVELPIYVYLFISLKCAWSHFCGSVSALTYNKTRKIQAKNIDEVCGGDPGVSCPHKGLGENESSSTLPILRCLLTNSRVFPLSP